MNPFDDWVYKILGDIGHWFLKIGYWWIDKADIWIESHCHCKKCQERAERRQSALEERPFNDN